MSASIHLFTDVLAVLAAAGSGLAVRRWRPALRRQAQQTRAATGYWLVLAAVALFGALWFGTVNLYLSQMPNPSPALVPGGLELGRSAFGAIFGGICGVEIYKRFAGPAGRGSARADAATSGSTGAIFVLPLSVGMVVGRIGCLFSGLADFTYGRPAALPWGWDFGDGIHRHPAPLYEMLAMAAFALWFFHWSGRRPTVAAEQGFYVFVAYYALQRFLIEFTKPYGSTVLGVDLGLDVFQIGAVLLFAYAAVMIRGTRVQGAGIRGRNVGGRTHAGG